jgi:probable F420-dependent oxidoreductase
MKIGITVMLTESTPDAATVARKCESIGFESMFLPEHSIIPVAFKSAYPNGGELPESYAHIVDPFIALATAASATSRIKLGTAICLVPEHNPIMLAKVTATLDHYSQGRLLLGVGAGWLAEEGEVMGVADFKRRWPIACDYIRAMKQLWTAAEASYEGKYVRFPPIKCFPKPVQKPHLPVYIGGMSLGAGLERTLKRVVEIGDGWIPGLGKAEQLAPGVRRLKELCAAAGRNYGELEITVLTTPQKKLEPKAVIDTFAEAGAHRLIFAIPPFTQDRMYQWIEDTARKYLPG